MEGGWSICEGVVWASADSCHQPQPVQHWLDLGITELRLLISQAPSAYFDSLWSLRMPSNRPDKGQMSKQEPDFLKLKSGWRSQPAVGFPFNPSGGTQGPSEPTMTL